MYMSTGAKQLPPELPLVPDVPEVPELPLVPKPLEPLVPKPLEPLLPLLDPKEESSPDDPHALASTAMLDARTTRLVR
jgi:hypothetical protein